MPKRTKLSDSHLLYASAEKRKNELEDLIREKKMSLEKAPPGDLHILERGKQVQFYRRFQPDDKSGTYISKKERQLIRNLVQKKYDIKVLKAALKEHQIINRFLSHLTSQEEIRELYSGLHPALKQFINPADMSDEDFIALWKSEQYTGKGFDEETSEFYTENGERVRSKSEILIANTLKRFGIPYKYEHPLQLRDGTIIYTDFLALNVRMRQIMYWEHCGMMDRENYANKAVYRIDKYEEIGLYPGKDLILTFESSKYPLKIKQIEAMIRQYLM